MNVVIKILEILVSFSLDLYVAADNFITNLEAAALGVPVFVITGLSFLGFLINHLKKYL